MSTRPRLKMLAPRVKTLGAAPRGWAQTSTGTTTERGYGAAWQRLRLRILERDRGLCQCIECKQLGRVRVATEVDHIVPKAAGGTDDEGNLQAINSECHKAKTAADNGRRLSLGLGADGWPVDR